MWLSPDPEPLMLPAERAREHYFNEHPVIAEINLFAGALMEMLSPMMWAALIVMFLWAEVFSP